MCEAYPVLGVPPRNIKKTSNGIDGFNAPKIIIKVTSDTLLGGASEAGMQKTLIIKKQANSGVGLLALLILHIAIAL